MRIIGGSLKGRRFTPPASFRARPTTDMAKENMFNILTNFIDFEDTKVLDLFAGTGSISYEFASRGCPLVVPVEKDFHHHRFICKCIDELKLSHIVRPVNRDVFKHLAICDDKQLYNLIFADPPFQLKNLRELPIIIRESDLLTKGGYLILEHGTEYNFSQEPDFWQMRNYGKVCFSFFEKK
ncbi:MAG: RsmD family RNA methyltransferase [Cytophagaceae bacterium]|jgi:16S rRNA (guanine(966)-N(2))-methyltransferase RsmD|nr:RsmD family RNA methyltransferase [Cytophagaceae bacterium]